jgi:hypothetical protein
LDDRALDARRRRPHAAGRHHVGAGPGGQ